jgi:tight adherence protein B
MMLPALFVFALVTGSIIGVYYAITWLPGYLAARRLDQRLHDVSFGVGEVVDAKDDATVVKHALEGPLPGIDRLLSKSGAGAGLAGMIAQSGVKTTPSAIIMISLVMAAAVGFMTSLFAANPFAAPGAAILAAMAPFFWLMHRKTKRMKRFEEQFPEALDMLSRAIRAGHAFQTAMGMVADELPDPVGPEFKKTFDQQNYGLPLKDALNELSERLKMLDVRFFVTAVMIQRDTGGNLAEILDNLAHVVRERFKILRQVRVHTAHGRFTGYVLLALPAALAVALQFINPEHMGLLLHERMGQMMLMGAIVMQTLGYFWIRKVIKIEV